LLDGGEEKRRRVWIIIIEAKKRLSNFFTPGTCMGLVK
jgi:hypothetical protein